MEKNNTKYQVGDKVLVKPNLNTSKMYFMDNSCISACPTSDMVQYFSGSVVTISNINSVGKYNIKEDGYELHHNWTDGTFVKKVEL